MRTMNIPYYYFYVNLRKVSDQYQKFEGKIITQSPVFKLTEYLLLFFFVSLCFAECKIDNCEACFNRNFCTKCKEGLYSHSGRCYVSCPPGQRTVNETMECVGEWSFSLYLLLTNSQ